MIEDPVLIRDFGIAVAILLGMFQFVRWLAEKSFQQIEKAHQQMIENNQKMLDFMDGTFKENTKAISEMVVTLKEHVRAQDQAIELLKIRR